MEIIYQHNPLLNKVILNETEKKLLFWKIALRLYTKVKGNIVTLKFTCKNAYGVPETHVMDIRVD